MRSAPLCFRVAGNFACFTRPEFRVARVSYPVITPSAARGILEAILMTPIERSEADKRHNKIGFRWVITRIGIVKKMARLSPFSATNSATPPTNHRKMPRAVKSAPIARSKYQQMFLRRAAQFGFEPGGLTLRA